MNNATVKDIASEVACNTFANLQEELAKEGYILPLSQAEYYRGLFVSTIKNAIYHHALPMSADELAAYHAKTVPTIPDNIVLGCN